MAEGGRRKIQCAGPTSACAGGPDSSSIGVPQAQEGRCTEQQASCGFAAPIGKLSGPPGLIPTSPFVALLFSVRRRLGVAIALNGLEATQFGA